MKKIGIFYGTTSGMTQGIVDELEFYLKNHEYYVFNVKDGIEDINNYSNLIFISPTYGVGELQKDWENVFNAFKKIDFKNKVIGIVSLGNQLAFGESFAESMRIIYDVVSENNGKIVGFTSPEGYLFKESKAVINEKFVGLAIDEHNDSDITPERISNWINSIKKDFL